jgi:hypothetical protein
MLDNHCFQPLPLDDVEETIRLVKHHWDQGQRSGGMLFSRPGNYNDEVHFHYKITWDEAEAKTRAWYAKVCDPEVLEVLGMVET